jgi:hypothetical protein
MGTAFDASKSLPRAHVPGAFQHNDVTVLPVPMRPREYVGREFYALNVNAGLGWIAVKERKRFKTMAGVNLVHVRNYYDRVRQ